MENMENNITVEINFENFTKVMLIKQKLAGSDLQKSVVTNLLLENC